MIPLPSPDADGAIQAWRLDQQKHAASWQSGEGARLAGGRWNNPGIPAVYCALNPATAILEVAVHKGFHILDTMPHILTALRFDPKAAGLHVVQPEDLPNPHWQHPVGHGAGQRAYGDALLAAHRFILLPSTVVPLSWNLVFDARKAPGMVQMLFQQRFALDPRLNKSG